MDSYNVLTSFAGPFLVTTLADTQTTAQRASLTGSQPGLSVLEIGLFAAGAFVVIMVLVGVACCYMRFKKRRKTIKLPDAKYVVATEQVAIEQQSFTRRTASVSSTGSAAALFMRQRSIRGRLESRLTQVGLWLFKHSPPPECFQESDCTF